VAVGCELTVVTAWVHSDVGSDGSVMPGKKNFRMLPAVLGVAPRPAYRSREGIRRKRQQAQIYRCRCRQILERLGDSSRLYSNLSTIRSLVRHRDTQDKGSTADYIHLVFVTLLVYLSEDRQLGFGE
jgi:hypothetical protein